MVGLASVVKAATQWFALDHGKLPPFVLEAEKYLAAQPHHQVVAVPVVIDLPNALRTGPIVTVKKAQGARGRVYAVAALTNEIVRHLSQVPQGELHIHVAGPVDSSTPPPRQGWWLPKVLAEQLILNLLYGTLNDLLRAQHFRWDAPRQAPALIAAMGRLLESADLTEGSDRLDRLEQVARNAIREGLRTLGLAVPKDLLRDRRGSAPRAEQRQARTVGKRHGL